MTTWETTRLYGNTIQIAPPTLFILDWIIIYFISFTLIILLHHLQARTCVLMPESIFFHHVHIATRSFVAVIVLFLVFNYICVISNRYIFLFQENFEYFHFLVYLLEPLERVLSICRLGVKRIPFLKNFQFFKCYRSEKITRYLPDSKSNKQKFH